MNNKREERELWGVVLAAILAALGTVAEKLFRGDSDEKGR